MMVPATEKDTSENATTVHAAPEDAFKSESAAVTSATTDGELGDLCVLEAVMGQNEPVTPRRITKLTELQPAQVRVALDRLCELGLLRRLNTIVESYTARSQ